MASPLVLVVTRRQSFAGVVHRQLQRLDVEIEIVAPDEYNEVGASKAKSAEVAFVDLDAKSATGAPLYRSIGTVAKDCQVILVCDGEDAFAAAKAAQRWEVFDYLLADSIIDPYRVAMLVQRARSHCLPEMSDIHAKEKRDYRRILGLLGELRSILKIRGDHPVVNAINRYKGEGSSLSQVDGGWLSGVYQHCLIDVICGRLKRLEQEFQLSHGRPVQDELDEIRTEILLVEDSEVCAEIAQHILESHGLDVTIAPTVAAAKLELWKRRPSLIVMDVHLGSANGLRLVEALRHAERYVDVPVIVCSADRSETTVKLAAQLNVQGYVLKPYTPSALATKVKSVLAQSTFESLCDEHEPMGTAS